jgi:predicted amidohydrolase
VDVLLAQLCPAAGDVDANARRAADVITASPQADLAVFGELFLSGYDLATVREQAVDARSDALAPVRRAAADARTAVLIGFVERGDGDELHNSVAAIDDEGRLVAVYRKAQLFGAERTAFTPGDRLVVAPLAGRRIGLLVCFDAEFPELARALACAGADLLVTVSANMEPYHADHELATRARALDNRLEHVYVNRVGSEAGTRFVGGSRVIAADGSVRWEAPRDEEVVSIAAVDRQEATDAAVQYLAQVPERLPVQLIDAVPGEPT